MQNVDTILTILSSRIQFFWLKKNDWNGTSEFVTGSELMSLYGLVFQVTVRWLHII